MRGSLGPSARRDDRRWKLRGGTSEFSGPRLNGPRAADVLVDVGIFLADGLRRSAEARIGGLERPGPDGAVTVTLEGGRRLRVAWGPGAHGRLEAEIIAQCADRSRPLPVCGIEACGDVLYCLW